MIQVGDIPASARPEEENKQNWPALSNIMQGHGLYAPKESQGNNADHDENDNSAHFLEWDSKPFKIGLRGDNISERGLTDLKDNLKEHLDPLKVIKVDSI